MNITEYSKQEAQNIHDGKQLIHEEQIMRRWHFDPTIEKDQKAFYRTMWKLRSGRHPCGRRLPAVTVGAGRRLYRLVDLLHVELAMRT